VKGPARSVVLETLLGYAPDEPRGRAHLARIRAFVERHAHPFDRSIAEGHLTASAVTVSEDGTHALLVFHRKLDLWLQPGGHAEPADTTAESVALREAREETGLRALTLHPQASRPFDVDIHAIPARPGEPAHEHLDLRFLVLAPVGEALERQAAEHAALRWFRWNELDDLGLDPGLRRALAKARVLLTTR
jgi:8-oxo-dGTP pyrophosphatase MutT (NUDIX family)